MNKDYLENNPHVIDHLRKMVEYEENNIEPDNPIIRDTDHETLWSSTDVGVAGSSIYYLEMNDFVERVYDSSSQTDYCLVDREKTKEIISEFEEMERTGIIEAMHSFPEEKDDLPSKLFDEVIGYDDVKWLLNRGLTTDKITNFLFVGPTGSAKTVFLLSIRDKLGGELVNGGEASGPGFLELLFDEKPKHVLVDEIDDMDNGHQKNMSSYMETGIAKETKSDKQREMKTNAKTIATANHENKIIGQLRDRFTILHFEKYDKDEFIEVCEHILPDKEDCTEEEAKVIAESVWDKFGEGDVRQAIQVARLSRGDPEKVLSVIDRYSKNESFSSF